MSARGELAAVLAEHGRVGHNGIGSMRCKCGWQSEAFRFQASYISTDTQYAHHVADALALALTEAD